MQSDFFESEKSSLNNNNNFEMAECSTQQDKSVAAKEDHKIFNELHENEDDLENIGAFSDSSDDGDQFINSFEEEDDVQLSSPSNSDGEQRWYAYRGRWGINLMENNGIINGEILENNPQNHIQQQQQQQQQPLPNLQQHRDDEETDDFLEMDFEPDTNSELEIENENFGHNNSAIDNHNHNNNNHHIHNNLFQLNQAAGEQQQASSASAGNSSIINKLQSSTGAKPKQFSLSNRNLKSPKSQQQQHASDGDNIFRITHLHNNETSAYNYHFKHGNELDVYNLGASCSSKQALLNDKTSYHQNALKPYKSPSKTAQHSHKQQKLHEEQNDQFLFGN